jgi:hypothetical protein
MPNLDLPMAEPPNFCNRRRCMQLLHRGCTTY